MSSKLLLSIIHVMVPRDWSRIIIHDDRLVLLSPWRQRVICRSHRNIWKRNISFHEKFVLILVLFVTWVHEKKNSFCCNEIFVASLLLFLLFHPHLPSISIPHFVVIIFWEPSYSCFLQSTIRLKDWLCIVLSSLLAPNWICSSATEILFHFICGKEKKSSTCEINGTSSISICSFCSHTSNRRRVIPVTDGILINGWCKFTWACIISSKSDGEKIFISPYLSSTRGSFIGWKEERNDSCFRQNPKILS